MLGRGVCMACSPQEVVQSASQQSTSMHNIQPKFILLVVDLYAVGQVCEDEFQCASDEICSGVVCVQCIDNSRCQMSAIPRGLPICLNGECVQCINDKDCTGFGHGRFCRFESTTCDHRRDRENRPNMGCIEVDQNFPICSSSGDCVQCITNSDCPDQLACNLNNNRCQCDQTHPCPDGQFCQSGGCVPVLEPI